MFAKKVKKKVMFSLENEISGPANPQKTHIARKTAPKQPPASNPRKNVLQNAKNRAHARRPALRRASGGEGKAKRGKSEKENFGKVGGGGGRGGGGGNVGGEMGNGGKREAEEGDGEGN